MKLQQRLALPLLFGFSRLRRLARMPAGAFRILIFHDILDAQRRAFEALMAHIAQADGFVTPAEAESRLMGATGIGDGRVPCLISFDDGFASNRGIAESVLVQHGVKALFFVCPGIVDVTGEERPAAVARGIFRGRIAADDRAAQCRMMDWEDIRALAAMGHEIGAHSMMHARLAGLGAAALEKEVGGACDRLAEMAGRAPRWFAWPFGDIESIDATALAAIGRRVRFCRSGIRGLNRAGQNRLAIFADHVDLGAASSWQRLASDGGLHGPYRTARAHLAKLAEIADHAQTSP